MVAASLWVLVEHNGESLDDNSKELLSEGHRLAARLGQELWALLFGGQVSDLAPELGRFGVDRVLLAESQSLSPYTTEPYTQLLADLIGRHEPSIFLLEATSLGQDLAPRLATRLHVGYVPDCVRLSVDDQKRLVMTRPICGDQAYGAFVCPNSQPQVATLRPGAFPIGELDQWQPPDVEVIEVKLQEGKASTTVIGQESADPRTIELTEGEVIVAAGRGVERANSFEAVQELADILKAPLAGSRPLVDLRLIPPERQVGQTGVTVAPKLYLACGISGASQHTMGMKDSELIVAIDIRREAPIFGLADLRVVGDLGPIVTALNDRLHRFETVVQGSGCSRG